jgi:hypothetical protein
MPSAVETVIALFDALARFDNAAIAAVLHDDLRYDLPFGPDMPTLDKAGLQQSSWALRLCSNGSR